MLDDIQIEPMTGDCILWRCLHSGPISCSDLDVLPSDNTLPWERYWRRNMPLLQALTRAYGACAILAREGGRIVGHLRFYPKAVWDMPGAGQLCLQQEFDSGPADDFSSKTFPPLAAIQDKTLLVHCLMTGSPQQTQNPYQRKGLGTKLARTLIDWATVHGWEAIEAKSFEDLPVVYEITGSAGRVFWEKLGFTLVERHPHPYLQQPCEFVTTLETQARAAGISPERAKDELVMRLEL